jgi:hypothetical protein
VRGMPGSSSIAGLAVRSPPAMPSRFSTRMSRNDSIRSTWTSTVDFDRQACTAHRASTASRGGWGAGVIDRLASDVQKAFPGLEGFSASNISRMRAFFRAYVPTSENSAQAVPKFGGEKSPRVALKTLADGPPPPVAGIPWGHNIVLLFRVRDSDAGLEQSDLANKILRDPYNFDFLTLRDQVAERDLEEGLLAHIHKFLIELGAGFAFVGQQVHLPVDGEDFYIDLD